MHKVGLHELRQKFSELVRRASRGERIGITKWGRLIAEIGPPASGANGSKASICPYGQNQKEGQTSFRCHYEGLDRGRAAVRADVRVGMDEGSRAVRRVVR